MTSRKPAGDRETARGAHGDHPEETEWLTDEQARHWRAFIDGTQRLNDALARDLEERAQLTLSDYAVLVRLSEAPERTERMSLLAAELSHSRSRMTHTVGRLEKRGLVERISCDDDGRGVNCVMTDAGFDLLARVAPGHVAAVRRLLINRISPQELEQLGLAMDRAARHGGSDSQ